MTRQPLRRTARILAATLVAATWLPTSVVGQARSPDDEAAAPHRATVLGGSVRDAMTGSAVRAATVILQPEAAGAFPGAVTRSPFATATRATVSDSAGTYRFDGVAPGVYRVYASALGYRPYSALVELRVPLPATVSLGLEAEPVQLDPLRVRGSAAGPFRRTDAFGGQADLARLMQAHVDSRRFLTTDVRELTHADVVEAVTLGEPDVFRALQRLPGVTTRSDYTAELWTRGAPWAHTRVYFDGVPLFNPLHALGMVSGVASSSLGAAWFHPGARSAGIAEGAAGVVDLQSRRGEGAGELNIHGDLSLMTAGLALDQRVLDGRVGWMLAGRRAYLDWLAKLAAGAAGRDDARFPYGFSEVAGRADAWVGDGALVEASWLWEADELSGSGIPSVEPMVARWGNGLGRVTVSNRLRGHDLRTTLGRSAHHAWVGEEAEGVVPSSPQVRRLSESRVEYLGLTGSLSPQPVSLTGPAWSMGYGLEYHAVGYYGPHALPIPRPTSWIGPDAATGGWGTRDGEPLWWNSDLPVLSLWGERSWALGDRTSVRGGVRMEMSDELQNSGPVRLAPRVSARFAPVPEVALSAGLARVHQYAQTLVPGGVHIASLVSSDVWLLAGPNVPAIHSDIATGGLELWVAPGRVATVNTFLRRANGVVTPDPRPGPLLDRPTFVTGHNRAYGIEASVRQLAGPVTGTASYTLTRSSMNAVGLSYPAAAERPHVLDLTALVRAGPALRLGGAFTAATGVAFTRVVGTEDECRVEPGCDPDDLPWAGSPHALRAPAHASLDLLADWSTRLGALEIGAYAQIRNVLGRENGTVYTGAGPECGAGECGGESLGNLYERGVPRLAVVGVRVRR
jgi:hypothetical protein